MARRRSSRLDQELVNFRGFQESQIAILNSIADSMNQNLDISIRVYDNLSRLVDTIDDINRSSRERVNNERDQNQEIKTSTKLLKYFGNELLKLTRTMADTANKFSQISNNLIAISGASGADVRSTRDAIVQGVITKLNNETGHYFDAEKSYSKLVDTMSSAEIGSLNAIEELSRPLLLASESMVINQTETAKLFNKWYTRYNFSSSSMESLLDEIRGNTAGNNASAEATRENISTLSNWMSFYTKGDASKLESMSKQISEGTSWLESMNVDTSRYTKYLADIASGKAATDTQLIQILHEAGYSAMQAQQIFKEGDIDKLYEALFLGENSIMQKAVSNGVNLYSQYSDARGMDLEGMLDSYNARNSANYKGLSDFNASGSTMVSAIDDKFNTLGDKSHNIMTEISERIANLQERVGIGLSDIISILTSIYVVSKISGVVGGGSGGAPGRGLRSLSLSGLSGNAASIAGGAATVGGVLAGGALAIDGIKGMFEEGASKAEKNLSGIEALGGVVGATGLATLGISNPVGWVALAIGGIAYLGKAAYKNAHELSGNAKKVSEDIDTIERSLEEENKNRLSKISELNYAFSQEKNLDDQIALMKESGLFKEEDLQNKTSEQLQAMIDSYKNAASSMDSVTDGLLTTAEKFYKDQQDSQQKDFVKDLGSITDNQQRLDVLELLSPHITDSKVLEKIDKATSNGKISNSEWKDILSGGKNAWFDSNTLQDKSLEVAGMQLVSGYMGWGNKYTSSANMDEIVSYYQQLQNIALFSKDLEEFDKLVEQLKGSEFYDEFKSIYGDPNTLRSTIKGYAVGSNYITSNQLAMIHEGEAIVPKKYNPAANANELEMLRAYYNKSNTRESTELLSSLKEFANTLSEIKEFLAYWRDDNIKRDMTKERTSKFSGASSIIAGYMNV